MREHSPQRGISSSLTTSSDPLPTPTSPTIAWLGVGWGQGKGVKIQEGFLEGICHEVMGPDAMILVF